ncbi:flagellar biosynthesis protein FlhB [Vallicoccus soli]|uniref:Flagellar biosynthetic protein FlhB n=1 Tax=Vallicoccus soli TaxID=2339232 RepID=A0A3A3ZCB2_9ACTN|nr:flagellar biosynthesis protein FlhB [Vallicoccus soli]RJK92800.1 flagellar biosynthesis protein FlhB [Vallicoccus soli]
MAGEKTEKPTPKKLKEARQEGRVARSQDIGAWASVLAASLLLPLSVEQTGERAQDLFRKGLALAEDPATEPALDLVGEGFRDCAAVLLPLSGVLLVVVVVASVAQGGLHIATKNFKPQAKRLNPFSGLKRMVGANALWELVKSLVKSAVVGFLLWQVVQDLAPTLSMYGSMPFASSLGLVAQAVAELVRNTAVAGLVMGVADWAWHKHQLDKQLRMSKQDVKDEHKQSEGDPHVKGQIRARQMAMSRNRMMSEIATADVVLVNPTHVAVALRYEPEKGAPRVVAKGAGAVAAKIREKAEEHRVPMVQDVPLARALHAACDLGEEVPGELFTAVARVLAFVLALKARGSAAGTHRVPEPVAARR